MKLKNLFSLSLTAFAILLIGSGLIQANTLSNLIDFNNTSDLTTYFNPSDEPQFTNSADGGIGDSGAIDVPLGSNEIWTTKQGYSVGGVGDKYTFSAYFKIQENSGYGGLGFSNTSVNNDPDYAGHPPIGIGMSFHGGGGSFVNNQNYFDVDWPPDLELGNWYKMILTVEALGESTYDLNFQIWYSDADGNLSGMKTEHDQQVVNTTLGQSSTIHGYFSAAGSRMEKIDDFLIELEGATFVEEGAPVVLTTQASEITSTSASAGGNVTDDQGSAITSRGVCWSTSPNPTTSDQCSSDGSGQGTFISQLANLTSDTTYYYRAFATNGAGTSYGGQYTLTTLQGDDSSNDQEQSEDNSQPQPGPKSSKTASSSPPSCTDTTPVGQVDLFQIDRNQSQATLYFTPVNDHVKHYHVVYGYKANDQRFGQLSAEASVESNRGVQSITINHLEPNLNYWFAVIPVNGCAVGDWSNWLKASSIGNQTQPHIFYRWLGLPEEKN